MKMKTTRKKKSGRRAALHIGGGVVVAAAVTGIAMWLWNALVPDIFGWSRVGYWQMLGLLALVHLLFGNMHGSMSVHKRHHDFHKRMHGMSREERREFIRRHMHVFDCEENPTDDAGKKE